MKFLSAAALAAGLCLGLGATQAQAAQKALLIGAGEYPYLPPKAQLSGPANDVRAMTQFLEGYWGFSKSDIRILVDGDASKQKILNAIQSWLPGATQPGDRVIIYYSGHGSQIPDTSGDEEDGKDETFVPTDFGRNGDQASDMLSDDEIGRALNMLKGREVILIADSCHSGTINRDIVPGLAKDGIDARPRYLPFSGSSTFFADARDVEPLAREVDTHLNLSAALPHQLAWETNGSGIFTQTLIQGLSSGQADQNGNGRITTAELLNFMRPKTEAWCQGVEQCRELQFTPNVSPRNEAFVLQPVRPAEPVQTVTGDSSEDVSDVLPERERDKIAVRILPGAMHEIGDEVQFQLTSELDGYLTLLDLTAEGKLVLLFPTDEDRAAGKTGKIRANSTLTVPDPSYGFSFVAEAPAGNGKLLAIVTQDRVDLEDLLAANGTFEPIDDKMGFIKEISGRLNTVWTGDTTNRSVSWAAGYKEYEIRP
ncbi:caspase family protein [Roseibium aggregatum]|uniref:Caspase family protein n=1 Tax=Roseibium aggregatum TaxID=187304 RepID=A0A939J322_9HYPH|nr:caspase family protein [Roseibium aggregatum]MBN9672028.1 caspase family protein [Roseibium aggregatum]